MCSAWRMHSGRGAWYIPSGIRYTTVGLERHSAHRARQRRRGAYRMHTSKQTTASTSKRHRMSGSITSLRTPRKRSEDQRTNLRRSYQAFMRKLEAGEPVSLDAPILAAPPLRRLSLIACQRRQRGQSLLADATKARASPRHGLFSPAKGDGGYWLVRSANNPRPPMVAMVGSCRRLSQMS